MSEHMDTTPTSEAPTLADLAARPGAQVQDWYTELVDTQYGEPRALRHTIHVIEPGKAEVHGVTTTHYISWHDEGGGDALGDPEGAEETLVARDRAREAGER